MERNFARTLFETSLVSKTPGNVLKTSPPNGEATWDSIRARTELVSRRKLYGTYLTVAAELYGAYLTYHTGEVRQIKRKGTSTREMAL